MEAPCLGNWVIKHAKSTKIGNTFGYEWVTTIIALSTHYQDIGGRVHITYTLWMGGWVAKYSTQLYRMGGWVQEVSTNYILYF